MIVREAQLVYDLSERTVAAGFFHFATHQTLGQNRVSAKFGLPQWFDKRALCSYILQVHVSRAPYDDHRLVATPSLKISFLGLAHGRFQIVCQYRRSLYHESQSLFPQFGG